MGKTDMSGTINYYPEHEIPVSIDHKFPLLGINISYKPNSNMDIYGGWSQAYRPMVFKDLIPGSTFEKVDPDIEDSYGYNLEAGFRGNLKFLHWDLSGYLLQYNNRFGTLAQTDAGGNFYTYRTNIGNSLTKGLELLLQCSWLLDNKTALSVFTSTALMDAEYTNAHIKSGNANIDIRGNKVESAPSIISRNGVSLRFRRISISGLYSYTSKTYADALNTVVPPTSTGAVGLVPSYGIVDINSNIRISSNLELRLNINNLTNKQYFTKRPLFYPGPGVWPSEGRSVNVSVTVKL
jgi:Fe(3+) dicitrate transport protein